MKHLGLAIASIILGLLFLVSATEFSGDGTYDVQKGDIIKLDNGWRVEILGIFIAHIGEQIKFRTYDPDGNAYPAEPYRTILEKIEGRQKYGTSTLLKVEIELLEVSGSTSPTDSPFVTEYEKAKIDFVSIDEMLPGGAVENENEDFEEINKELTYKDGVKSTLRVGESKELSNGYSLKFDYLNERFGPSFSIYNNEGNLIDEELKAGKSVGFFGGSYILLEDFDETTVNLNIIDGSKIIFGTGWNLFSIPVEDGDGYGTVLESTCNEATIWTWNVDAKNYEAVGKLAEGTKIPSNKGLWVKIRTKKNIISDEDCAIIVSGDSSVTTNGQKLKTGWNLIGAPITSYGEREIFDEGSNFNLLTFEDIIGDCKIEKGP